MVSLGESPSGGGHAGLGGCLAALGGVSVALLLLCEVLGLRLRVMSFRDLVKDGYCCLGEVELVIKAVQVQAGVVDQVDIRFWGTVTGNVCILLLCGGRVKVFLW